MRTKSFKAQVKAPADDAPIGEFEALVSVFGNIDSYGERVQPGAFTKTLKEWEDSDSLIPVIWSHAWSDPFAHLGVATKAWESEQGLNIKGQIRDLETNPTAMQVARLLKDRRITQFSFAYDVIQAKGFVDGDVEGLDLIELKLHEVGPCLIGVNPETSLIEAKAQLLAKRGQLTESEHSNLVEAYHALGAALDAAIDRSKESKSGGREVTDEANEHRSSNRRAKALDLYYRIGGAK